jgi:hypothetical protein
MRSQCLLFKPHEQTLTQSEYACFSSVITNDTAYPNLSTTRVRGILYDMAKAYNCIGHEILLIYILRHLNRYTIVYVLSDRKQRAEIKSSNAIQTFFSLSNWERIKCGVPQQTILGLLLFIIHINDIPPYKYFIRNCNTHSNTPVI